MGQPQLLVKDPARGTAGAEDLVQVGVADHLQERLALTAAGADAEHRASPLVHEQDALLAVDGHHPLHHAVENRGGLGALGLEVGDLLAQPQHHHVERPSERAGARTANWPSLICRAMACISTTGRVTRPATKIPMPKATASATRPPA